MASSGTKKNFSSISLHNNISNAITIKQRRIIINKISSLSLNTSKLLHMVETPTSLEATTQGSQSEAQRTRAHRSTLQSLTLRTKIILELRTSSFQKFKSLRTAITQRSSTKSHSTISSSNTTLRQDIIQPQRCSNLNIMRTISSSILLLGFATAGQVQSDKLQRQSINHAALPTSSVINQHAKSRTGRDLHMSNYPLSQEGAEREAEGRSKT